MKRRLLASILTLVMMLSLLPTSVLAVESSGQEGKTTTELPNLEAPDTSGISGGIAWSVTDGTLTISPAESPEDGYTSGQMEKNYPTLVAPSAEYAAALEKAGYEPSESNGNMYFHYQGTNTWVSDSPWKFLGDQITKIVVEDGVTNIGARAFRLPNITEVSIPDSVTSIGYLAFEACANLKTVNWTGYWTGHEAMTYEGFVSRCSSLGAGLEFTKWLPLCFNAMSASIEDTLFSVDFEALDERMTAQNNANDYKGESLDGKYPSGAFQRMPNVKTVKLTDKYGLAAFKGAGIEQAMISNTVTAIPGLIFEDCKNLTSVEIPAGVETIGQAAFRNSGLQSITFNGEKCPTISDTAFDGITLDNLALNENMAQAEAMKLIATLTRSGAVTDSTQITPEKFADYNVNAEDVTVNGSPGSDINHNNYPAVKHLTINGAYESQSFAFGNSIWGKETLETLVINAPGEDVTINGKTFLRAPLESVRITASTLTFTDDAAFLNNMLLTCVDLTGVDKIAVGEEGRRTFEINTTNNGDKDTPTRYVYFKNADTYNALGSNEHFSGNTNTYYLITNGGTFPADYVFEDGTLGTPENGLSTFDGWYTRNGTDGNGWGDKLESAPAANVTYYAKWSDAVLSGDCGKDENDASALTGDVTWKLDENADVPGTYTLTISAKEGGSGKMCDSFDNVLSNVPTADGKGYQSIMAAYGEKVSKIVVEEGVTYLGANLTRNTKNVEIKIPASVTEMYFVTSGTGSMSTLGNTYYDYSDGVQTAANIAKITVDANNPNFKVENGVLLSKDGKILYGYTDEAAANYTVPDGVEIIAAKAFARSAKLTSLTISDSVKYIGEDCFDKSYNLSGTMVIPASVETIGKACFSQLPNLTGIEFKRTDLSGYSPMRSNINPPSTGIKTVTFAEGTKAIPDSMLAYLDQLETIDLPESLEVIGNTAFAHCTALKAVNVKENLTTIGSRAFSDCPELATITLTKDTKLTEIPDYTFIGTKLTEIVIPDTVTRIGEDAFSKSSLLTSIVISTDSQLKAIGNAAFAGTSISSLYLPSGASRWEMWTFGGTTKLAAVDLTAVTGPAQIDEGYNPFTITHHAGAEDSDYVVRVYYMADTSLKDSLGARGSLSIYAITNGGTFKALPSSNTELATPEKEGYRFAGWYTDPAFADGTKLAEGAQLTTNTTYYAKWVVKEELTGEQIKAILSQKGHPVTGKCVNNHVTESGMNCSPCVWGVFAGTTSSGFKYEADAKNDQWIVSVPVENFISSYNSFAGGQHDLYSKDTLTWIVKWDVASEKWVAFPKEDGVDNVVLLTHAPTVSQEVAKIKTTTGGISVTCLNGKTSTRTYGLTTAFVYSDQIVSVKPEEGTPGSYLAVLKLDKYVESILKNCTNADRTHRFQNGYDTVTWRLHVTKDESGKYVWSAEPVTLGKDNVCHIAHDWQVTFDANNGEEAKTVMVAYGNNPVTKLSNPEKTGYTFKGWYLNGKEFNFATPITGDITLTAEWETVQYTITYELDGGTVAGTNPTEYNITSSDITLINPTKTGYTFKGWSGTDLAGDNNQPVTIPTGSTGDRSYTANWTANTYTVTFDKNADDATLGTASKDVTYDETYGNLPTPVRAGFNFVGWFTAAAEGVKVESNTVCKTADDHTLYAHWTAKEIPELKITATPNALRGGGKVSLTVDTPKDAGTITVTYKSASSDEVTTLTPNADGKYTVTLPNRTETYTFTVSCAENDEYAYNTASCPVSVTRRTSSATNPGSTISVPSTPNGTVTVDPSTASKGETVTITTKPSKGYELGSIEVLDKNGDSLKLKDLGNGKYSFVMPDGKVSVEAEFVKAASTSFVDVPANAYFADAVEWAVENGVTNGLTDTMFGPYESCTRAQIVTFLWRAAGSPEPKAMSSFVDVSASAYYAKAVAWAVENGITNGMTETTFAPSATCTRGQSVTFLYRALGKKVESSASFTDVAANAFYADAVNWAVASDVTNGTSATTFSPNADCTRAEIVTFLYRAYQGK